MNAVEKAAWTDEENKILSFYTIDNGRMITKAESLFGAFVSRVTKSAY